ncbi:period circadian protein homolog 1 isoform X2 [Petromyzon marinus]|uniref:period circadian protein homolog 1 isoform X2 n=1 Tax=Petromyzon marinus TaxID=7757 RepID=UPI003F727A6F
MDTEQCEASDAMAMPAGTAGNDPCRRDDEPSHPRDHEEEPGPPADDVDMKSNGSQGNDSSGNDELNGSESNGTGSHDGASRGAGSSGRSRGSGKDSALMLLTSESNKSSNSQSPSPPSSSNAFSLLSSSEQDHPSTSGCSSEQSMKAKTQKALLKTLKDLKARLPPERRVKGKSSTLATLQYAVSCIKQIRANEEYYQLWTVDDGKTATLDIGTYTMEELETITSEYTPKSTDTFAMVVSLISGRMMFSSEHTAWTLGCRKELLSDVKFVEMLAPQDVSVFYSATAPGKLPPWGSMHEAAAAAFEYPQEKPFFCRIRGGGSKDEAVYLPFRLTPYLMKVREGEDGADAGGEPCCLVLAERVHSGYEEQVRWLGVSETLLNVQIKTPRIPPEKRIFTTTHTPGCVFLDVDERAIPLLGYLPQDLVGTPMLTYIHPNDRHLMLAVHKKILKFVGQPFDHSPFRFCSYNGDYVTIDTSWSSFVNPWSRKVAFIIGRHKVRTGPLNEDVFASPAAAVVGEVEPRAPDSDVADIQERIHKLLLQPVHNNGSSGYGSLMGSNGHDSHGHRLSLASSSEGTGAAPDDGHADKPMSFAQICVDVQQLTNPGRQQQQRFPEPLGRQQQQQLGAQVGDQGRMVLPKAVLEMGQECPRAGRKRSTRAVTDDTGKKEQTAMPSYQQINCLYSIIRYLESCNVPKAEKRKCPALCEASSSTSDDEKPDVAAQDPSGAEMDPEVMEAEPEMAVEPVEPVAPPAMATPPPPPPPLAPLPLPLSKAESAMSVTSQCSYSSTIVHVGDRDKKNQPPDSEIAALEDTPNMGGGDPPEMPGKGGTAPPPEKEREREEYKKVGLTKEVLSAHTLKEEQTYIQRFLARDGTTNFWAFGSPHRFCLPSQHRGRSRDRGVHGLSHQSSKVSGPTLRRAGTSGAGTGAGTSGRLSKSKPKRAKQQQESSDSGPGSTYAQTPFQRRATAGTRFQPTVEQVAACSQSWLPSDECLGPLRQHVASLPPHVAVGPPGLGPQGVGLYQLSYPLPVLPGFQPVSAEAQFPATTVAAATVPPYLAPVLTFMMPQNYLLPAAGCYQVAGSAQGPAPAVYTLPPFALASAGAPGLIADPSQASAATPAASMPMMSSLTSAPASSGRYPQHIITTGVEEEEEEEAPGVDDVDMGEAADLLAAVEPAALAGSRASTPGVLAAPLSPGLEEQDSAPSLFDQSRCSSPLQLNLLNLDEATPRANERADGGAGAEQQPGEQQDASEEGNNNDTMSTSSDLLDLLLQEDSHSGTDSAASGSGSSGSGSSGSRSLGSAGSGGSNACDTSRSGTGSTSNTSQYFASNDSSEVDQKERKEREEDNKFKQLLLQDPIWLLMANTNESVMMTYQLPSRDVETVLKEDREKLKEMQKLQPRFTEAQRRELCEVHPWLKKGGLPVAINIQVCECGSTTSTKASAPFDVETHEMDDGGMLELGEEGSGVAQQAGTVAPQPMLLPPPPPAPFGGTVSAAMRAAHKTAQASEGVAMETGVLRRDWQQRGQIASPAKRAQQQQSEASSEFARPSACK